MQKTTFEEIVEADKSASGSLVKIVVEDNRLVVKDEVNDKAIKKFRPSNAGIEAIRWVDNKFPQGVYMHCFVKGKVLRYRHRVWPKEVVERAYRKMGETPIT